VSFIEIPNMAALSHRKLASCDSYHAPEADARDTLYKHSVMASRRTFFYYDDVSLSAVWRTD